MDYDPVTRSGNKASAETAGENWTGHRRLAKDTVSGAVIQPQASTVKPASLPTSRDPQALKTTLKRGHMASFVGVFLFTVVVYFRPYEMFSWLSWAKSMAFVIAIATLVIYVPTQLGLEGNLTTRPREINLVLLLALAALLSIPLAFDKAEAFYGFNEYFKVVLMFIVMVNVVRTEKRLKLMLLLVLITSCIVSAAAINDYRLGIFLRDLARNRIRGSIGNLFDNPNDLALHLVTMVPIAIGLLLGSRGVLKKLFFGGCAALISVGVVTTFSRGGFIGLVCVIAVLAWRLAKSNKFLIVAGLPVVLVAFLLFAPGGYTSRMSSTTDDSGMARREELKRSLYVALHHPLFGVGINNYVIYSDVNHATHNAYTQVASELGFPAMVVYIMFLIAPLKGVRRISRETSANRRKSRYYYLAVGFEASLIGFMVSSFFLSVAYLWYIYYLTGYAICLRRLYQSSQLEENAAPVSKSRVVDEPAGRNLVPDMGLASTVNR